MSSGGAKSRRATMTEKQLNKWRQIQAKGFKRFLWVNGFFGWGVPTTIGWSVAMSFFQPGFNFGRSLVTALIVFPIGGLAWGWWVWRAHEKKYLAARRNRTT